MKLLLFIAFTGMVTGGFILFSIHPLEFADSAMKLFGRRDHMPFWYALFTAAFYKKQLNGELETALSVITASYLRCESIITAVDENITYLNPPVVDVFRGFFTLMFHPVGKLILAITGTVVFVSLAGVIRLSKPVLNVSKQEKRKKKNHEAMLLKLSSKKFGSIHSSCWGVL